MNGKQSKLILYHAGGNISVSIDSDKKDWFEDMWSRKKSVMMQQNTGVTNGFNLNNFISFRWEDE